jgi:hypothetical protein
MLPITYLRDPIRRLATTSTLPAQLPMISDSPRLPPLMLLFLLTLRLYIQHYPMKCKLVYLRDNRVTALPLINQNIDQIRTTITTILLVSGVLDKPDSRNGELL